MQQIKSFSVDIFTYIYACRDNYIHNRHCTCFSSQWKSVMQTLLEQNVSCYSRVGWLSRHDRNMQIYIQPRIFLGLRILFQIHTINHYRIKIRRKHLQLSSNKNLLLFQIYVSSFQEVTEASCYHATLRTVYYPFGRMQKNHLQLERVTPPPLSGIR